MYRFITATSALNKKEYSGEWCGKYYSAKDSEFGEKRYKIYIDKEAITISRSELLKLMDDKEIEKFKMGEISEIIKIFLNMNEKECFDSIKELLKCFDFQKDTVDEVLQLLTNGTGYCYE